MKIELSFTDAMVDEMTRLQSISDLKGVEDMVGRAFTLLRIHVDAARRGAKIIIEESDEPPLGSVGRGISLIELPFNVKRD